MTISRYLAAHGTVNLLAPYQEGNTGFTVFQGLLQSAAVLSSLKSTFFSYTLDVTQLHLSIKQM